MTDKPIIFSAPMIRAILRAGAWRRRRLSPLFVEWLMGWPCGHALCACSETGFIRWQQDMRGALSRPPMASGPWTWAPSADEPPEPCQIELI